MDRQDLLNAARTAYERTFGAIPPGAVAAAAPGRVNLIGEHTDYTGGFVLPIAIDLDVVVLAAPVLGGDHIAAYADRFRDLAAFPLRSAAGDRRGPAWQRYVEGVVRELQASGVALPAARLAIAADLPEGAGLSSSAAVEVAVAFALLDLAGRTLAPEQLALLCRQAEHRWAGVQCGVMDQFAVTLSRPGHALFLDTRSLAYRHVPLDGAGATFVVVHSGLGRSLAQSAYNERLAECAEGLALLRAAAPGLASLRDVTAEHLAGHLHRLPDRIGRRVRHVVAENARVVAAVRALEAGDAAALGHLMNASHDSLRDDYAVSSPQLDALVDLARATPGVLGSRLTGAGFGGCTVSLVRPDAVEAFIAAVPAAYQAKTDHQATVWPVRAAGGVTRLVLTL
ncbi:MAG: galactokinase [Chloroflexi bacterium]|nr:galactokinase [Chloroflexota bacterium]